MRKKILLTEETTETQVENQQSSTPAQSQPSNNGEEATKAQSSEPESKNEEQSSSPSSITADDIKIIEDENNKDYFPNCSAAIKTYKESENDDEKKKAIETFLTNFVKEKSLYILKTDERLGDVRAKLGNAEYDSVDSFVEAVKQNQEALAALNIFLNPENETSEKTKEQQEEELYPIEDEDPWITSTLGRLRSKNLI